MPKDLKDAHESPLSLVLLAFALALTVLAEEGGLCIVLVEWLKLTAKTPV